MLLARILLPFSLNQQKLQAQSYPIACSIVSDGASNSWGIPVFDERCNHLNNQHFVIMLQETATTFVHPNAMYYLWRLVVALCDDHNRALELLLCKIAQQSS